VSLLWAGALTYLCYLTWPEVPLDIAPVDPATVLALRATVLRHVGLYALLAIGPPVLLLLVRRVASRRRA
jgi:hypothetical protein